MAATDPTDPSHNSGDAQESKPVSCATPKAAPSLLDDLVDTVRWIWEILVVILKALADFGKWCARNPLDALLLAGVGAVAFYFFAIFHPFVEGKQTTAKWALDAWQFNQAYGAMVPWIALGLFWYHRDDLKKTAAAGSNAGLAPLIFGIFAFIIGVRCLQPRFALVSIPFLLYGAIRFVWGQASARVVLFPCAFSVFMVPVGALEQATSNLQFIITGIVGTLSHLLGIAILAVGTTLTATDGSFNFEIAEGCSGIRSITAMTMLTAVFVHLTQDRLWKKVLIFACSLLFAIIGNVGRIFTVVLVAKFYDTKFAAGIYHDYSGYVFFPIALLAMLGFSQFVNLDFRKLAGRSMAPAEATDQKPVSL
jgi:exosortase